MIFEFLVVCRMKSDSDLTRVLTELLRETLEENLNEFDDESVSRMIVNTHRRIGEQAQEENGDSYTYEIVMFHLDLPDNTESPQFVIDDFTDALHGSLPVVHAVRFDDPLLQVDLEQRAKEIYSIEMKLRRVLTMVYLHAYQSGDPYNLLCEESIQPMAKEKPTCQQMKTAADNQFFHLTFGQYVGLNQRPEIKLPALLEIIQNAGMYDAFRAEILRQPIEQEDDAGLLAGLKQRMDAIEKMRNCVAHNRRPTRSVKENYENAQPLLEQLLDQYLAQWATVNGG